MFNIQQLLKRVSSIENKILKTPDLVRDVKKIDDTLSTLVRTPVRCACENIEHAKKEVEPKVIDFKDLQGFVAPGQLVPNFLSDFKAGVETDYSKVLSEISEVKQSLKREGEKKEVNKESLGLGKVDDTSDINKPMSLAVAKALTLKLDRKDYKKPESILGMVKEIEDIRESIKKLFAKSATVTNIFGGGSTSSGGGTWGSITGTLSDQTDLQTALTGKVLANMPITPATNTKITYDDKGLVTAGAALTDTDIPTLPQSKTTGLIADLAGKVLSNMPITPATNTKITYDDKGLVTAGAVLIDTDIPTLPQSKTTGLVADLAGKAALVHTHVKADITDLSSQTVPLISISSHMTSINTTATEYAKLALTSGTQVLLSVSGRVGVISFRNSASANSGYIYTTGVNTVGGTPKNFFFFSTLSKPNSIVNNIVRVGFTSTVNATLPAHGVYFQIAGLTVTPVVKFSSVQASTNDYVINSGDFYRYNITTNADASEVRMWIVDITTNTIVDDQTITTNIPTTNGMAIQIMAYRSNASAVAVIANFDDFSYGFNS